MYIYRYSPLAIPCWLFHIGYSLLAIPYWVFPSGYSLLSLRRRIFSSTGSSKKPPSRQGYAKKSSTGIAHICRASRNGTKNQGWPL